MSNVSVIIPNYNYARFLPERIGSILKQSAGVSEMIFLDDASTDDSIAVFRKLTRNCSIPIREVVNPVNSGSPFRQWNKGAALARGKYLWIAEADDVCEHDFLAHLAPLLDDHPHVALAYSQSRPVDDQGHPVDGQSNYVAYTAELDDQKWTRNYIQDGVTEVLEYLMLMNTIPNVSATLIRRSAIEAVGGAPENYRLAGDWALYIALLERHAIAFCAKTLNLHRKHQSTITTNSVLDLTLFRETLRVQNQVRRRFPVTREHRASLRERFLANWAYFADSPYGRLSRVNLTRLFFMAVHHYPESLPRSLALLRKTLRRAQA